jgi:hypothetical protein
MHCIGCIGGLEGGELGPPLGGAGETPLKRNILPQKTCHLFRCFFGTWIFADGFLFLVKEL